MVYTFLFFIIFNKEMKYLDTKNKIKNHLRGCFDVLTAPPDQHVVVCDLAGGPRFVMPRMTSSFTLSRSSRWPRESRR